MNISCRSHTEWQADCRFCAQRVKSLFEISQIELVEVKHALKNLTKTEEELKSQLREWEGAHCIDEETVLTDDCGHDMRVSVRTFILQKIERS